jgi:hypothetical protein
MVSLPELSSKLYSRNDQLIDSVIKKTIARKTKTSSESLSLTDHPMPA